MEKRLDIKITGDNSGFARSATLTVGLLNKIGSVANLLGIGSLAGLGYKFKQAIDWAGELKDASLRIGVGVEMLQAFERAAAASGLKLEQLTHIVEKLVESQADALAGGSLSPKGVAFGKLGISFAELRSLNPEQLFLRVSHAIDGAGDGSEVLAASIDLMGKTGGKALAAMRDGFASLAEQIKNTNDLLTKSQVDQLDDIGDKADALALRIRSAFAETAIGVDDTITLLAAGMTYAKELAMGRGSVSAFNKSTAVLQKYGLLPEAGKPTPAPEDKPLNFIDPSYQSSVAEYEAMMARDALAGENRTRATTRPMAAADALARVGGFRGGGADSTQRTLREHTQLLKRVVKELEDLNREE